MIGVYHGAYAGRAAWRERDAVQAARQPSGSAIAAWNPAAAVTMTRTNSRGQQQAITPNFRPANVSSLAEYTEQRAARTANRQARQAEQAQAQEQALVAVAAATGNARALTALREQTALPGAGQPVDGRWAALTGGRNLREEAQQAPQEAQLEAPMAWKPIAAAAAGVLGLVAVAWFWSRRKRSTR